MSIGNLGPNMLQSHNIVINQVPIPHSLMSNINTSNGMSLGTTLAHAPSIDPTEMKTGIVVETIPLVDVPVQGINQIKPPQLGLGSHEGTSQLVIKSRLTDLIREVDPFLTFEDDVEEEVLCYADDLVDRILNGASVIAKHRHGNTVEVKDVQQYMNRNCNIWASGFGTDELRPYKRSPMAESHKQRLALIRKALKKY